MSVDVNDVTDNSREVNCRSLIEVYADTTLSLRVC